MQYFAVVIKQDFTTGMYFFCCVDPMTGKQCNIFFIYQMRNRIRSVFQIQQAASFRFLYPFIRIVVAVENNTFMFDNDFSDNFFCFCHYIFGTFQLVGNITDSISSDGVHNNVGVRNRRSGTQHTELEFVTGKCKWRCTVTVTGVFLETWYSSYPCFHLLTGSRYILTIFFVSFQNTAQVFTQEHRNNSRRSLVGT